MCSKKRRKVAINRETLVFLAWLIGQSNLEQLRSRSIAQAAPHEVLPAQLLYQLPPVFEVDAYGPVYQPLFLYRLTSVDWLAIDEVIRGVRAVCLDAERVSQKRSATLRTSFIETNILWEATRQHQPVHRALHRLGESWQHDPTMLVSHLRLHFQMQMPLLLRSSESAWLVQEFLMMSLARVDWRTIAARVLSLPLDQVPLAHEAEEEPGGWSHLQFALLQESLRQAERTFGDMGSDYWASWEVKHLCLGLADQCCHAQSELGRLQEQGKLYAPVRTKEAAADRVNQEHCLSKEDH